MKNKQRILVKPTRAQRALDRRLHGKVNGPIDPDYQTMAETAIRQRDQAITTLTRRANAKKILADYDELLYRIEAQLVQMTRLEQHLGDRLRKIATLLEG